LMLVSPEELFLDIWNRVLHWLGPRYCGSFFGPFICRLPGDGKAGRSCGTCFAHPPPLGIPP